MRPLVQTCLAFAGALAICEAGCAGQSSSAVPTRESVAAPALALVPEAKPARCKGQKTTSKSASVTEKLSTHGGLLCVPVFHGLGGAIAYPSVSTAIKVTVLSTTVDNGYPYPGSGTPLLYVELTPSAGATFGTKLRSGGGLKGKSIKAGGAYTAFAAMLEFGLWQQGSACYSVAAGKKGPAIGGLGSLLGGLDFSGSALLFEVYPNQQSSTEC